MIWFPINLIEMLLNLLQIGLLQLCVLHIAQSDCKNIILNVKMYRSK